MTSIRNDLKLVAISALFILIACMALSYPLWVSTETIFKAPLFGSNTLLSTPFLYVLTSTLTISGISTLIKPNKYVVFTFLLASIVLVIDNQMRLQPWFYMSVFIIFLYGLSKTLSNPIEILDSYRILFSCMYFFSGLFKLNTHFFEFAPNMLLGVVSFLPGRLESILITTLIYLIPITEMILAILLLNTKTRKFGVIVALFIHLFIIFTISARLNWNTIIIPWNLGLMWIVYVLFFDNKDTLKDILAPSSLKKIATYILFLMLPLTSIAGIWDRYLSFHLYTYNTPNAIIQVDKNSLDNIPYAISSQIDKSGYLSLNLWAMNKLNVPVYPEERVLHKIIHNVCQEGFEGSTKIYINTIYREKDGELVYCSDFYD